MKPNGYQFWLDSGRRMRIVVLDGDKMKFRTTTKERAGGNGFGIGTENVSPTVTVRDRHLVGVFR